MNNKEFLVEEKIVLIKKVVFLPAVGLPLADGVEYPMLGIFGSDGPLSESDELLSKSNKSSSDSNESLSDPDGSLSDFDGSLSDLDGSLENVKEGKQAC